MESIMNIVNWIIANYQAIITGLVGILTGLTGIFMLVPGDQPEKAFKGIADFLAKFSKK